MPQTIFLQQRMVAAAREAEDVRSGIHKTVHAAQVTAGDVFEDVKGDMLVLDLLDEMPQNQRGDAALTVAEQMHAVLDQHLADGERHGFETFRVGQVERQAA